jgi:predicted unusual protein kinase regulating ubiquinone biosynthesis (AarF/ABC1/UbiB family)
MCGMKHGIIHGDLHPGNIGVVDENMFVLFDCGLVVNIKPNVLREVFSAILSKNNERFQKALLDNKLLYIDEEPIGTIQLNRVVWYIMEYLDDVDIDAFFGKIQRDELLNSGAMRFHIDPDMFLISRTLSLLEGTCKSIDPDFSYNDIIFDMVTDMELITEFFDADVFSKKALIDVRKLTRIDMIGKPTQNFTKTPVNLKNEQGITPLELALFVLLAANVLF